MISYRTTYRTLSLQAESTPFQPGGRELREPISNEPCDVHAGSEADGFITGAVGDLTVSKIPPKETEFVRLENGTQTGSTARKRTGRGRSLELDHCRRGYTEA